MHKKMTSYEHVGVFLFNIYEFYIKYRNDDLS